MALQEWLHDARRPNNHIQLTAAAFAYFATAVTWKPFSAARCQIIFAKPRSTFKALNIIHYNAVHSQLRLLAECGKCTICTSPPLSFSTLALPCLLLTRCHSIDQEPGVQKQRNVLLIKDGCCSQLFKSFQFSAELSNGAFFNRTPSCMHVTVSVALYQRCNCDYLDLQCTQNAIRWNKILSLSFRFPTLSNTFSFILRFFMYTMPLFTYFNQMINMYKDCLE